MDIRVKTNKVKEQKNSVIAVANVELGDHMKVRYVTVKVGKKGQFVDMPSVPTNEIDEKGNTKYKDVFHAITAEARQKLIGAVLKSLETGKEVVIKDEAVREGDGFSVRLALLDRDDGLLAVGSIVSNEEYVVNYVTVRENDKGETFVAYPSFKSNEVNEKGEHVFKNFAYPNGAEAREYMNEKVLEAFRDLKELSKVPKELEGAEKEGEKKEPSKAKGVNSKLKSGKEKSKTAEANKDEITKPKAKSKDKAIE